MRAFSLIELLVVVVILGIIAAIAVPNYYSYKNRVAVQNSYREVLEVMNQTLIQYQQQGTLPNTITVRGATITRSSSGNSNYYSVDSQASTLGNIYSLGYKRIPTDTSGTSSNYAGISVTIGIWRSTLGLADTDPSCPIGNVVCTFNVALLLNTNDGTTKTLCGIYSTGSANNLPTKYLPQGCACTNMQTIWNNTNPSAAGC